MQRCPGRGRRVHGSPVRRGLHGAGPGQQGQPRHGGDHGARTGQRPAHPGHRGHARHDKRPGRDEAHERAVVGAQRGAALSRGGVLLDVHGRADREQLDRRPDDDHRRVVGPHGGHRRGGDLGHAEQHRPGQELGLARVAPAAGEKVGRDAAHRHAGTEQPEPGRAQVQDPHRHQRVRHLELDAEAADQQGHRGGKLDPAGQVEDPAQAPAGRGRAGLLGGGGTGPAPGQHRQHRDHQQE
jgi:hypothetical protein